MKNTNYWKQYPIDTNAESIEYALSEDTFMLMGEHFTLLRFYTNQAATNVLITPGSSGHAYVFAELGYLIHKDGFNVFIMPNMAASLFHSY